MVIIIIKILKFFISISFCLVFIYTTELFPVPVKGLGMGLTNFFGKFGIINYLGCASAPIFNYIS